MTAAPRERMGRARVVAPREKLNPATGRAVQPPEQAETEATGASYEEARDAAVIPEGWGLIASVVLEHLPG